jgi:hypothetical protein
VRASGVEAGLISAVVKYTEVERLRPLMVQIYPIRTPTWRDESQQWPDEGMVKVVEAISEERGRQLAAMTDAMSRFVRAVFSS